MEPVMRPSIKEGVGSSGEEGKLGVHKLCEQAHTLCEQAHTLCEPHTLSEQREGREGKGRNSNVLVGGVWIEGDSRSSTSGVVRGVDSVEGTVVQVLVK